MSSTVLGDAINSSPRIVMTNIQVSAALDRGLDGYLSSKLAWTASQVALAEIVPGLCEYTAPYIRRCPS